MANNNVSTKDQMAPQESQTNAKIQKGGPLNVILMVVLLLIVAGGTLMYFQKGQVMAKTSQYDDDIKQLNAQLDQLRGTKVEVSKNASDALADIQKNELDWSEIINDVTKLLPLDETGKKKINVISYSGSGEGKIAINMVTEPAGLAPYADVSKLISAFNNSIFFKNAYIPSISKGTNVDGNTTLSFVLNLSYQKPETGTAELNLPTTSTAVSDPVTAPTSVVKVPAVKPVETNKVPRTNN